MPDFMGRPEIKMNIAVLSGKGGTGKTLVSVNLATVAKDAIYIDCDVEEPNGHLFFKPHILREDEIVVKIPHVDNDICNGCRECVEFCKFNALAHIKDRLIIFEEVCHSCGGCLLVCPEGALIERDRPIGKGQKGISEDIRVYTGIMITGEASGVPIIKRLLAEGLTDSEQAAEAKNRHAATESLPMTFIDCPPGSACTVMESIQDADYCVLVAEPTIFGVHNLNLVYELVKLFHKPFGVILNKCLKEENPAKRFCEERSIKVLGEIPFDKELGEINSKAQIAALESSKYHDLFSSLLEAVKKEAHHEAGSNS